MKLVPLLAFGLVSAFFCCRAAAAEPFDIPCGQLTGEGEPDEAVRRRDWPAAIAAQKVSVSQMCDNRFRWMALARIYQLAGDGAEALRIAAYAFDQEPNQVALWMAEHENRYGQLDTRSEEERSLDFWDFSALTKIEGFATSEWGRDWAAAEAARDRRIARGRQLLAAVPAQRRPADFLVTRPTCPFECCTYREWTVEEEIELFESAAGLPLERRLKPGDKVLGLTGNVHLRPRPIFLQRAIKASTDDGWQNVEIAAGDLIFELEYLGEGSSAIWHRGRILNVETGFLLPRGCLEIDDECWGDFLDEERLTSADYQWWVKVRLDDGSTAWARAQGFGNMDGCG